MEALERVPPSGRERDQVRASVRGVVPYLDVAQGVGVVDDALDCLAGDIEPRCDLRDGLGALIIKPFEDGPDPHGDRLALQGVRDGAGGLQGQRAAPGAGPHKQLGHAR